MSRKLKILHVVTVLSIALYYGTAFLLCGMSFDESKCTDLGIVIAPLFIPILILVPATIIVDLAVLGRKLAPHNHKQFVSHFIPISLVAAIILVLSTLAIFTYKQDHYSIAKTVKIIQNCQATDVGYNGTDIYLSTSPSAGNVRDIKVPGSGHARIAQTIKDSAARCNYKLIEDQDGFHLDY